MSSFERGPLALLVRVAIFLLIFAGLAEVWFRTITPACDTPVYYQDSQWKIMRYDSRGPVEGLWTVGRLAWRGGQWRVNNDGWISSIDYRARAMRDRQLVALVGDSFIEGFLTDADQHVDVYLSDALGRAVDVYSFGLSGWYLEQYVAVSRYVSAAYSPDLLVVFVNEGEIARSVRDNGVVSRYLWQITTSPDGFTEVAPTDIYVAGRMTRPARLSAVVNYLRFNAKITLPGMRTTAIPQDPGSGGAAAKDPDSSSQADAWEGLVPAADYMVDRLCAENPGVPIIFVTQGERYLSAEALSNTPLGADARAVQAVCQGRPSCYFLDLRSAFSLDWATHHQPFEAADGGHWNAYANHLVAGTLATFIEENDLLGTAADEGCRWRFTSPPAG